MRFHVLGTPFILTNAANSFCAFTQKARKFCKMMKRDDNEVFYYGHKDSEIVCTELIPVLTDEDFIEIYGQIPDWTDPTYHASDHNMIISRYQDRCVAEIKSRMIYNDIVATVWGTSPKLDELKDTLILSEPGIGCYNFFTPYCAFESYAVMNVIYGKNNNMNPRWYDCVIPNYFDVEEFTYQPQPGSYFLYVGRIITIKGVEIVIKLAEHLPHEKFIIAGLGSLEECGFKDIPSNIEQRGRVSIEERNNLMGSAKALLLPSLYSEPFGGVVIEAMLCGTPVITTDWGVFNETNHHGKTGYRCRNMDHFLFAAKNITKIDRFICRKWALENFTLDPIYLRYKEWYEQIIIQRTNSKGFYAVNPDRTELDWLNQFLP